MIDLRPTDPGPRSSRRRSGGEAGKLDERWTTRPTPRLDGAWCNSFDGDHYTTPGGNRDLEFGTCTHRIENDDGAWQDPA